MWDKFFEKYGVKTPAIPEGFVGKDGE
jgi:hypothetical protein